jgi:hypothetical protein
MLHENRIENAFHVNNIKYNIPSSLRVHLNENKKRFIPFKCDSTMILNKLEAASAPSTEIGLLSASTSCKRNKEIKQTLRL